ncbi:helix-turn-helix transcriptional regulator [Lactiplantibacillus pentosus]|uniref:helix-turn-helix domain-containing protein n=1 Tax=Lactiplantibacillus pentosus TaxID=1589 RepID=UPI001B36948A|nr:helix-turn-helix transcriptional regulator [Lactiplantibacillus pentosus]MBQ0838113.1 helix-turn-helix transcriptional regulator [Lactiplantibacillus pentosus]MBU7503443.1 helix-turn-helix transcriptional regulator [Lactiplantibacillus pentosus]MCT3066695.1 XRE family transcriptional regulator [Lactiplantibacillus pentosus]MCT3305721.1 XRE family transcriptional regulator [Lactiplantibacillus pentosus]MDY1544171.1 helix-turn-helix transcriptional regulator [Lactiplantibacillus pentosus]
MVNIWNQVEIVLKQRQLNINQLAKLMGLKSNAVLYEFKHGKIKRPSFELMERIADALDVSMDIFRQNNTEDKDA